MDLKTLLPIIIVALLTLVGNISYFEYKFRKEGGKKILRQKLTNLLLPLYFILKKDELLVNAAFTSDEVDIYEYLSDIPKRLMSTELYEVISKNLHLADDELHEACLQFLAWGYNSDSNERFQRLHGSGWSEDATFESFRKLVYSKFHAVKKEYLET